MSAVDINDGRSKYLERRHAGPKALISMQIPCAIWAEDALDHYGVPTGVFDLFCLVEDEVAAARSLEEAGFTRLEENHRYQHLPELVLNRPRLSCYPEAVDDTDAESPTIVLLPAKFWRYPLELLSADISNMFPPLPALLEGFIDTWLDAEDLMFREHLKTLIAYVYGYIPRVHEPAFGHLLRGRHHKEYHMEYLQHPVWERQRDRLKAIRDDQSNEFPIKIP